MRIHALKKLKDDKKIKWREAYTDKSLFLKDQFEYAIGPSSYFRFEGKQVDGPGEWYVVVSPSGAHDVEPKWFCGIRKLPDSWPAGGKKFDNIVDAFNYAFDTWGVPKPHSLPRYTASDLRGISKRIKEFKEKRESEGEKPVEKGKQSSFRMFRIEKEAMAGGNIYRASLIWHAGEFENMFANVSGPTVSYEGLIRSGGFASVAEAEVELTRLKAAARPVRTIEAAPITTLDQTAEAPGESSGTPVDWAEENNWIKVAMDELGFDESSVVGAFSRTPNLSSIGINCVDSGRSQELAVDPGSPSMGIFEGIVRTVNEIGGNDIAEIEFAFMFEGQDEPSEANVFLREGERATLINIVEGIRSSADDDRTLRNWIESGWRDIAQFRRLRLAALIALAGRQERLENLPMSEEVLQRQDERVQELVRRSPFEEGIDASVSELRRLRNQFRRSHQNLSEYGNNEVPAHTYVEFSPRDSSRRILYLSQYSSGKSFGQSFYINDARLEHRNFINAFVNFFSREESERAQQDGAAAASAAAAFLRSRTTTFTVERTGWSNPVEAVAFGNNMSRRQMNEVLTAVTAAVRIEPDSRLLDDLRNIFSGGVVTLALTGGPDGGPLSVPVRNGAEKSLLYDALGGFWAGSYRVLDGLNSERFPRSLVGKDSRNMLDELVISSSSRTVNARELINKISQMAEDGGETAMSEGTARTLIAGLGRRETWTASQFHAAFPRLSGFDIINIFGSIRPVNTMITIDSLKQVLKKKPEGNLLNMLAPNRAEAKLPDGSYPQGFKTHFFKALRDEFGDSVSTADLSLFMDSYEGQNGSRFTGREISAIVNAGLDLQGSRLEPITNFIGGDFNISTISAGRGTTQTPTINLTGAGYIKLFRGLLNGVWNVRSDFPNLYERIVRSQMIPQALVDSQAFSRRWNEVMQIEDQSQRLDAIDSLIDGILEANADLPPHSYFGTATQYRAREFQDNILLRERASSRVTPGMVERQYDDLQGKIMGEIAKSLVLENETLSNVPEDTAEYQNLIGELGNIRVSVPKFSSGIPSYMQMVGSMEQNGSNPWSPRQPIWNEGFEFGDDVLLINRDETHSLPISDVRNRRVCMYNLATATSRDRMRPYNINPLAIFQITDWSQVPISRNNTFGQGRESLVPKQWTNSFVDIFSRFYDSIGRPCPYRAVKFKTTYSAVAASARSNYLLENAEEGEAVDRPIVDDMVTGARNFGEHVRMGLNGYFPLGDLPYRQTLDRLGERGASLTGEQLARSISYRSPMNRELRSFLSRVVTMQEAIRGFTDDVDRRLVDAMLFDRRQGEGVLTLAGRPWYDFAFSQPDEITARLRRLRSKIPASTLAAVTGYVENIETPFVRATSLRRAIPYNVLSDDVFQELFQLPRPNTADAVENLRKSHIMRRMREGRTDDGMFSLVPLTEPVAERGRTEWDAVVDETMNVVEIVDSVADQQQEAEELAGQQTEQETGDEINEDEDPEEDVSDDAGEVVVQDSALDNQTPAPDAQPSPSEILRRQREEMQRLMEERRTPSPEAEPAEAVETVPDEGEDEGEDESAPTPSEILRRQREEMQRLMEQRRQQQQQGTGTNANDRDSASLIGLLKTARRMCRLGMHDIAANINSFVRSKIENGDVGVRRRLFERTARSFAAAAESLAREGKIGEAEEINRLASSYRKKYEQEPGE